MITYLASHPIHDKAVKIIDGKNYNHNKSDFLKNDVQSIDFPCTPEDAFSCSTGKCSFWVAWDVTMTPCGLLSQPSSYPLRDGFVTAWNQLGDKLAKVPVCFDCRSCSKKAFCFSCPSRLYSETGQFDKKSTYLCEIADKREMLHNHLSENPEHSILI